MLDSELTTYDKENDCKIYKFKRKYKYKGTMLCIFIIIIIFISLYGYHACQ